MADPDYRLKLTNLDIQSLTAKGGILDRRLSAAALRAADTVKREITAKGRVNTGLMRQSVSWKIREETRGGLDFSAEVGIYVFYGNWQDQGNGPVGGFIYPKRAKMLRFKGRTGAFVFAKKVRTLTPGNFLAAALAELDAKGLPEA